MAHQMAHLDRGFAVGGELRPIFCNRRFEIEFAAVPVDGLTFEGSLGYTDPKYKQFLYRDPVTNLVIDAAGQAHFPYVAKTNLQDSVIFTGAVSHEEIPAYLGIVDIAVQPGANE